MSQTARIPADSCRAPFPGAGCSFRSQCRVVFESRCLHPAVLNAQHDNLIRDDRRPRWCPFGREELIVTFSTRKVEDSDGY